MREIPKGSANLCTYVIKACALFNLARIEFARFYRVKNAMLICKTHSASLDSRPNANNSNDRVYDVRLRFQ
jgi:hypothetical protein